MIRHLSASDMTTLDSKPYQGPGPNGTGLAGFLAERSLSCLRFAILFRTTAPRVEISPKEYGIEPKFFDGRTVLVQLTYLTTRPEYITVNFVNFVNADNLDANESGSDIKHGLMLFGDPPATNSQP